MVLLAELVMSTILSLTVFGNGGVLQQQTIDPNDIDALLSKAESFYDQERYQEAITYYDKVLAINASHIDALNGKAEDLKVRHIIVYMIEVEKYANAF